MRKNAATEATLRVGVGNNVKTNIRVVSMISYERLFIGFVVHISKISVSLRCQSGKNTVCEAQREIHDQSGPQSTKTEFA